MSNPVITVIGRIVNPPTAIETVTGSKLCRFSLVTVDTKRGAQGGVEESDRTYFDVSCWNRVARNLIASDLKAGTHVCVVGKFRQHSYTSRDGHARTSMEISVGADGCVAAVIDNIPVTLGSGSVLHEAQSAVPS